MISPTDLAWAAGFFEGEGSIMLLAVPSGRSFARLSVEVSQVDRDPLDWLKARWGGPIYCYDRTSKGGHTNAYSRWITTGKTGASFLSDIAPYIIRPVVKQRIAVAIAYQAQKTNTWANRTPKYAAEQRSFVKQMRDLNRRVDLSIERAVLANSRGI